MGSIDDHVFDEDTLGEYDLSDTVPHDSSDHEVLKETPDAKLNEEKAHTKKKSDAGSMADPLDDLAEAFAKLDKDLLELDEITDGVSDKMKARSSPPSSKEETKDEL